MSLGSSRTQLFNHGWIRLRLPEVMVYPDTNGPGMNSTVVYKVDSSRIGRDHRLRDMARMLAKL
jgi:hypothetical protein